MKKEKKESILVKAVKFATIPAIIVLGGLALYYKRKSDIRCECEELAELLYDLSYERWISIKSSGEKMKIKF